MIDACAPTLGAPSLARDILASADCLIGGRVQTAYAALLAPGGSFVQALTIALTIYVAIVGYRLVLGYGSLTLGEMVPHFIKIGVIVALATSWPSYQVLVFNLLFHGPEQLADSVVSQFSDGAVAGQGDVLGALQALFDRITDYAGDAWAQVAPATPVTPALPAPAIVLGAVPSPTLPAAAAALPFQLGAAQFVAAALWFAALVMMAASVGVLLVVRIILALLLVLGPVFIACALFSGTRGLFEGWLRTTVKFAVVPLFTLPLTAALVAVLLPFVDRLDDAPIESFRDGPALAIVLVVLVFAAVLFQVVRLAGGIAGGLRLPRRLAVVAPHAYPAPAAAPPVAPVYALPGRANVIVQGFSGRAGTDGRTGADAAGVMQATRVIGGLSPPANTIETTARLGQGYRRLSVATTASPPRRTGA